MKENRIDRLIELLNEYSGKERVLDSDMGEDWFFLKGDCLKQIRDEKLISRRFGFIQRLVENDKIDRDKFKESPVCYRNGKLLEYPDYEKVLMLLSIQDNPIEDLISYLK